MRLQKALLPTLIVKALCWACAAQTGKRAACEPVPEHFSLGGETVYPECAVDRKARPTATVPRLNYTPSGPSCGRVAIDVVVDASGRPVTETARVARSTDPTFTAAVLSSLVDMRYQPALKDGQPVPQLVRLERAYATRVVVVPAGTPRSSVRLPRTGPPC